MQLQGQQYYNINKKQPSKIRNILQIYLNSPYKNISINNNKNDKQSQKNNSQLPIKKSQHHYRSIFESLFQSTDKVQQKHHQFQSIFPQFKSLNVKYEQDQYIFHTVSMKSSIYKDNSAQSQQFDIKFKSAQKNKIILSQLPSLLRITDGLILILDILSPFSNQIQQIIRYSLLQLVTPIIVFDNLDKLFLQKNISFNYALSIVEKNIDMINVIILTYQSQKMCKQNQINPVKGNIIFSSSSGGWGFTLPELASLYHEKFKLSPQKIAQKLWGDHYFDKQEKKWSTQSSEKNQKSFINFILKPLSKAYLACYYKQIEKVKEICNKLNVLIEQQQFLEQGQILGHILMKKWIPLKKSLISSVIKNIPSPQLAQKYKYQSIFKGQFESQQYLGIKQCNSKNIVQVYIPRMIPYINKYNETHKIVAIGRVLSGTLKSGEIVKILGKKYVNNKKADKFQKQIKRLALSNQTDKFYDISEIKAGNIVLIFGIEQYIQKTAFIISSLVPDNQICTIKHNQSIKNKFIRITVKLINAQDLPQWNQVIRWALKIFFSVDITINQTGNVQFQAENQEKIQQCLQIIRRQFPHIQFIKFDNTIIYKQSITITQKTNAVLVKSQNKHNRYYGSFERLDEGLISDIDFGKCNFQNEKSKSKFLINDYSWQKDQARRIWAFQPQIYGANIAIDATKGVQYMNQIKDSAVVSFQYFTNNGALMEEKTRGIKFNLQDCLMNTDSIHRGGAQVIPAFRRLYYGLQLKSEPALQQPVYLFKIKTFEKHLNILYNNLNKHRGLVMQQQEIKEQQQSKITIFFIPLIQIKKFLKQLNEQLKYQFEFQMNFDHYQKPKHFSLKNEQMRQIIINTKRTKGLKQQIYDDCNYYLDKQ